MPGRVGHPREAHNLAPRAEQSRCQARRDGAPTLSHAQVAVRHQTTPPDDRPQVEGLSSRRRTDEGMLPEGGKRLGMYDLASSL